MSRIVRSCPLCDKSGRRILGQVPAARFCAVNSTYREDFSKILGISQDTSFPIAECTDCGFVYAGIVPPQEFLNRVYDEVIDPDAGRFESLSPSWVAHQLRLGALMLGELVDVFGDERFSVLDFGCGYGTLLQALPSPRVECIGFESSQRCLSYLRDRGVPVSGRLEEVRERGPYHGIILSDVLEHVPAPRELLSVCRELLVAEGLVCVNVPAFDRASLDQAVSDRPFPRTLNPWEHLNYFSPGTLRSMLSAQGFVLREPAGPVDVGVRPRLRGLRRLGNSAKSILRLARYAMGRISGPTLVLGQKSGTLPFSR